MDIIEQLDGLWQRAGAAHKDTEELHERLKAELDIARRYAEYDQANRDRWGGLITRAVSACQELLSKGPGNASAAVEKAEEILAPIGQKLKEFTVHCCGHAHIDMNWMWPWQETVSTTRDTFTTVDRLMEAFPEFCFSQSQASTYLAAQEYSPEVFEAVKKRVAEGRWEVTASTWVEGEKNLAAGETLCRQMLYTRQYFKEKFGLPFDAVKIDWEPDMFGHSRMLPAILNRGGVTRYYFCRAGKKPRLFWWQAPDGSRVLAFQDRLWYNGVITPDLAGPIFDFEKETGLKDYLFMYGVGDHGGGPTRRDLRKLRLMQSWPIYPTLRASRTDDFYSAVEAAKVDLPVICDELNTVFEGCYTSQSSVKRGNRISENELPKAETIALAASVLAGMPYPQEKLREGWQHAMFCQFHDILPGSGIHATYEYSTALFQEIAAITESVTTRGLRKIASKINTAALAGAAPAADGLGADLGDGMGAGAGDPSIAGGVTAYNAGAPDSQPFLVYNPMGWKRSEVVLAKVWNVAWPHDHIRVRDGAGKLTAGQVVAHGDYWGHTFTTVAFPADDVPALGYRTYAIERCAKVPESAGVTVETDTNIDASETTYRPTLRMENDLIAVDVETKSGSIVHLVDKKSGKDFVPQGGHLGLIEVWNEASHGMTAWVIGQIESVEQLTEHWRLDVTQRGPHRGAVVCTRKYGDSTLSLEIAVTAGSPRVDFTLNVNWLERGTPERGVPMLRAAFPVNVTNPKAVYEVPFGDISREADGREVPALKWADLSGEMDGKAAGLTLVNADKYGHSADGSTLRLTLLRSSFDPDPLPEMGAHTIRYSVTPRLAGFALSVAAREGWAFNAPMVVASTDSHEGALPTTDGWFSIDKDNVMLVAAKKAEDSDSLVARFVELEGRETDVAVSFGPLVKPDAAVIECDLLEQPLQVSSAKMQSGTVRFRIPAHGIVTLRIG